MPLPIVVHGVSAAKHQPHQSACEDGELRHIDGAGLVPFSYDGADRHGLSRLSLGLTPHRLKALLHALWLLHGFRREPHYRLIRP